MYSLICMYDTEFPAKKPHSLDVWMIMDFHCHALTPSICEGRGTRILQPCNYNKMASLYERNLRRTPKLVNTRK